MKSLWLALLLISLCYCLPLEAGEKEPRVLVREAILPVSRAEAWHYWTSDEGIQQSVGVKGSDIELKNGGKYEIYFGMDYPVGKRGTEGCKVLCYDPLEMLA